MDSNYREADTDMAQRSPRRGKKHIVSTLAIILGAVLVAAGLGLVVHNMREASEAGRSSLEKAEILNERILDNISIKDSQDSFREENSDLVLNVDDRKIKGMPVEEIDGNRYIGVLEIPSLNLSLPVMYNWNYSQLRIAPCRYSGSYYTDDLVICGHNYRTHFSPLKSLSPGDKVFFVTVMGERLSYVVSNIETIRPTAIEEMIDNSGNSSSSNEWDMTLFTCTTGGRARFAVRLEHND